MTRNLDTLAAEYLLGLTDASQTAIAEEKYAADAMFRKLVFKWQEALSELDGKDALEPHDRLWAAISERLDEAAVIPGTRTLPMSDGVWERIGAGIERKVLHVDRVLEVMSYYVRMEKGATMQSHAHGHDEHCVVLSGELEIGGKVFSAGTYHFASRGVDHPEIVARTDAVFYVQGAL